MKRLIILLSIFPFIVSAQITAEEVLAKAIKYHDPNGDWSSLSATFMFNETRPDGSENTTSFELDNSKGYAKVSRGEEEEYEVQGDEAKVLRGDKGIDRALMMRNYYLYLWGLPMKLNDQGTPIDDKVGSEIIDGIDCYVLRVPYEKDIWYFFIHKETGRMVQYKFYKDELAGNGELIKLEDEIQVDFIKIPQRRSWYTLPEMKYLGTDILLNIE